MVAPPAFHQRRRDGSLDDPVQEAARMAASQLGRDRISRDDLIAHLMLGFWVLRCPHALAADAGIDVWASIANTLDAPLDDAEQLTRVMAHLLRTRNRVAHHEPVLFRAKHIFTRKGAPKDAPALVTSLLDALPAFVEEAELTVSTATTMAPTASKYIAAIPDKIRSELGTLTATLNEERRLQRERRDARLAARDAERDARLQGQAGES